MANQAQQEALLKVARAAVDMVLQQIAQQMGRLADEVQSPVQAIVQEVSGGAWIGNGANKFLDEIANLVVPSGNQIQESCQTTTTSITNSVNIVDDADAKVNQLVSNLDSLFQGIYN